MHTFISGSSIYGKLLLLIGALLAIPLITIPFYPNEAEHAVSFLLPAAITVLIGTGICYISQRYNGVESGWKSPMQKGSTPVMFAWCMAYIAGSIPFIMSGQLSPLHALFESASGWTTTGLTLTNINEAPHIFLFHRSFMQYCGGLGFVLMVAMLVHGKQSVYLYDAEGHPDRLMPSLKGTARTIFLIYNGFLVVGTVSYRIFGMPIFDSICHTMSALSTAGFSTQANSIGAYRSLPIEIITVILMLVGGTNFASLFLMAKGKLAKLLQISEIKFMFGLIAVFVPLIALSLIDTAGMPTAESFIGALFGTVSTFTTTGYSTMNYAAWPPLALGLLMLLMLIGGGIGSTAGGIKLIRTWLLLRLGGDSIRRRVTSARRVRVPYYMRAQGKTVITDSLAKDTVGYTVCYLLVVAIGTLLITASENCSLSDAVFEFASAFGTVGISNGLTSLTAKPLTLVIEIIGMTLGRLEMFIVFVGAYTACGSVIKKMH